jgi:hypothetical protein
MHGRRDLLPVSGAVARPRQQVRGAALPDVRRFGAGQFPDRTLAGALQRRRCREAIAACVQPV